VLNSRVSVSTALYICALPRS